jgi:anti-sigma factor RsiW
MSTIESTPIPCKELVELVTDYLEGALAPAERARIDAHLADCDGCTAYLEQMRFTLEALGHIPEETISEAARRTLMRAFGERHSSTS